MPRVGERRFAILGALLLAAGLGGIAMGGRFGVMAVAILGFSMLTPSLASLLSLYTPADMQGEVLGLGQSGLALARILGPYVGNVLFFGYTPQTPYWVAAGIMVAAFVAALGLRRPAPAPVADT